MKAKRLALLMIIPILLFSCEKDTGPYIQVKAIENLIYLTIKAYRLDNGLDGPFTQQPWVVGEAQVYSYKMANGVVPVGTDHLQEHWDNLDEKWNFYNKSALVLTTESNNEAEIVDQLLQIPGADSLILGDITQCAVGVESDTAAVNYVTVLLMKAD